MRLSKMAPQHVHEILAEPGGVFGLSSLPTQLPLDEVRAEIAGGYDDRVGEVDDPSLAVR